MIHIERLPYYPDLIRRGEIDASFTGELLQLFPCTATYICRAEIVEKQQGIDSAIKVINEAMEYGGNLALIEMWICGTKRWSCLSKPRIPSTRS